jgi:CheY-like chemotaxis protein
VLPTIFEPFFQVSDYITRNYGGLGLGLTIAKAIVEAHRGEIFAASAGPNEGATFIVRLHLAAHAAESFSDTAGITSRPDQPVKVLLVEDHSDTARAMQRLLNRSGFSVKIAGSAESALNILAGERYDLLISDIGLPDATGYELMKQVQQKHRIAGIALSGYGMESDIQRSHEAGFLQHLVKPVTPKQLQDCIRNVLAARPEPSAS